MSRPARARIDLAALRHNYRLARTRHGGRTLAVIKADAYGHGAVCCAQALADEADAFAVAVVEEALALRAAGIRHPIPTKPPSHRRRHKINFGFSAPPPSHKTPGKLKGKTIDTR